MALAEREPKAIENRKKTIVVRGPKCSQTVQDCMKDLYKLKKPDAITYNRPNDVRPFEDASKLERWCKKMDMSLFLFGSHNKKRPDNLVFGRLHDYNMLDMIEFGIDQFHSMASFKNSKVMAQTKPCLLFAGEEFADQTNLEMQRIKNYFIDFFRGVETDSLRLAGIEHVLQFTSLDKKVMIRSYRVMLKKSGQRTPRIELEEIGPHIDLTLRRSHLASDDLFRSACKQIKNVRKTKKVKNITEDVFGSKLGRVHIEKQEIGKIQNRKVKALKETQEEKSEKKKKEAAKQRQMEVEAVFGSGGEYDGGSGGEDMDSD